MKVTFREALSLATSVDLARSTFVFIGKGYNFPAAAIFARHLGRTLGKPVELHDEPGITGSDSVNLFQTQSASDLDAFILRDTGNTRVIPFAENTYTTKAKWGKLVGGATLIEVTAPTKRGIKADIEFACSLMGVSYDEEGVQAAADNNGSGGWTGIFTTIEYAELNHGCLNGHESVVERPFEEEVGYMEFKDTFLFKLPKDTADMVMRTENYLDYTQRIINDMALYFAILIKDSERATTRDVALAFGQNEWFLRNRLLPRLRTMGPARVLGVVDKLSHIVDQIMKGEASDGQAQIAATSMLLLC